MSKCNVIKVIVDDLPKGCGECPMMQYIRDVFPACTLLPQEVYEITGNPYDMNYRRSDCPLEVEKNDYT